MKQTATYWDRSSIDQFGDTSFVSPVVLAPSTNTGVRWQNVVKKFINARGNEEHCRAVVWSETTEFEVGGYLYLGSSSTANPESVDGADLIKMVEKIPDIENRFNLYKAYL